MLEAFCDETGTHAGAQLTCVGGYVFEPDNARMFTENWAQVLQPLTARGIRYFHAAACSSGQVPFSNLSAAERDALFGDLVSLIRDTITIGFAAAIEDVQFQELMAKNTSDLRRFVGSKYTACCIRCLSLLGEWAKQSDYQGQIAYRFESGNEFADEADEMMRKIANDQELSERFHYASHSFHPKAEWLPLQAADFWIWGWQRAFAENRYGPVLRNLFRRPGKKPHYIAHMTSVSLSIQALVNSFYGVELEGGRPQSDVTKPRVRFQLEI